MLPFTKTCQDMSVPRRVAIDSEIKAETSLLSKVNSPLPPLPNPDRKLFESTASLSEAARYLFAQRRTGNSEVAPLRISGSEAAHGPALPSLSASFHSCPPSLGTRKPTSVTHDHGSSSSDPPRWLSPNRHARSTSPNAFSRHRGTLSRPVFLQQRKKYWATVLNSDASKNDILTESESESDNTGLWPVSKVLRDPTKKRGILKPGVRPATSPPSWALVNSRARGKQKEHKCDRCAMVFKRKYDLDQHTAAVHQKLRPHTCHVCRNSFAHKGTLSKVRFTASQL